MRDAFVTSRPRWGWAPSVEEGRSAPVWTEGPKSALAEGISHNLQLYEPGTSRSVRYVSLVWNKTTHKNFERG